MTLWPRVHSPIAAKRRITVDVGKDYDDIVFLFLWPFSMGTETFITVGNHNQTMKVHDT